MDPPRITEDNKYSENVVRVVLVAIFIEVSPLLKCVENCSGER